MPIPTPNCKAFNSGAALHYIYSVRGLSPAARSMACLLISRMEWSNTNPWLAQGEARATVARLAALMDVSREYAHRLIAQLKDRLDLIIIGHERANGARGTNGYRFAWLDAIRDPEITSARMESDNSLPPVHSIPKDPIPQDPCDLDEQISVEATGPGLQHHQIRNTIAVMQRRVQAIATLDAKYLWQAFCAWNRKQGHKTVPLRWLVGFLRKWRGKDSEQNAAAPKANSLTPQPLKITPDEQIALATWHDREQQERELLRSIGSSTYAARVKGVAMRHGCPEFRAKLIVRGRALRTGEIRP